MRDSKTDSTILTLGTMRSESSASHLFSGSSSELPYARAWKEFQKLDRYLDNEHPFVALMASRALECFVTAFGISVLIYRYIWLVLVSLGLLLVGAYIYSRQRYLRFMNWPCPRCHSVWPGTDKRKVPTCPVCGLRLYQESA